MSGMTTVRRSSFSGVFVAYRNLCDTVAAFIELNRITFRALQQLIKIPLHVMEFQVRFCAIAIQLLNVPLKVAQGSFELMKLMQPQSEFDRSGDRVNGGFAKAISALRSIVNALQIPLKLIVFPIAILEAPFRLLSRQPTHTVQSS